MRHLRPITAFLAITAITVACSTPGASSGGDQSQGAEGSQGGAASEPAASTGDGGGGGGGAGANGSAKYEITGDISESGELAFTYISGGVSQYVDTGWVAYFYSDDQQTLIQINSMNGGSIVNFGTTEFLIPGTVDTGCDFNFSQNDASGLKGTIDCQNVTGINNTSGAQLHVNMRITVDAHT